MYTIIKETGNPLSRDTSQKAANGGSIVFQTASTSYHTSQIPHGVNMNDGSKLARVGLLQQFLAHVMVHATSDSKRSFAVHIFYAIDNHSLDSHPNCSIPEGQLAICFLCLANSGETEKNRLFSVYREEISEWADHERNLITF